MLKGLEKPPPPRFHPDAWHLGSVEVAWGRLDGLPSPLSLQGWSRAARTHTSPHQFHTTCNTATPAPLRSATASTLNSPPTHPAGALVGAPSSRSPVWQLDVDLWAGRPQAGSRGFTQSTGTCRQDWGYKHTRRPVHFGKILGLRLSCSYQRSAPSRREPAHRKRTFWGRLSTRQRLGFPKGVCLSCVPGGRCTPTLPVDAGVASCCTEALGGSVDVAVWRWLERPWPSVWGVCGVGGEETLCNQPLASVAATVTHMLSVPL